MQDQHRYLLAAIGWTVAVGLMVVGSFENQQALRSWSLLVGLGACVFTGDSIVRRVTRRERVRLEDLTAAIGEGLASRSAPEDRPSRIH
jgi:hypothetical protein